MHTHKTQDKSPDEARFAAKSEGAPGREPAYGLAPPAFQVQASSSPAVVQRREATYIERRAWLSFFDHYIPRMFLNNYMDDTGATITLTSQQMEDCNPIVDVRRSQGIQQAIARLQAAGGGSQTFTDQRGWGGARTNGSLGNFTIFYTGTLTVDASGDWAFNGTMRFYDFWDFDPKPFGNSGRSTAGELKTRVAAYGLPGRPFEIQSVTVPVAQSSAMSRANWGSGTAPVSVGDHAVRSGADIGTGADIGVGAGPLGDIAGAEFGGNAAEDLN